MGPPGRGVQHLEHRPSPSSRLVQQQTDAADVVGPEDGVEKRRPFQQRLAVLLGEAAADGDLHAGSLLLDRLQMAEVPVQLVVGVLADAARVEHDDVRLVEDLGTRQSLRGEHRRDAFGVVLVHLAPEGANEESARFGHRRRLGAAGAARFARSWQVRPEPGRFARGRRVRPGRRFGAGGPGAEPADYRGAVGFGAEAALDRDQLISLLRAHRDALAAQLTELAEPVRAPGVQMQFGKRAGDHTADAVLQMTRTISAGQLAQVAATSTGPLTRSKSTRTGPATSARARSPRTAGGAPMGDAVCRLPGPPKAIRQS